MKTFTQAKKKINYHIKREQARHNRPPQSPSDRNTVVLMIGSESDLESSGCVQQPLKENSNDGHLTWPQPRCTQTQRQLSSQFQNRGQLHPY